MTMRQIHLLAPFALLCCGPLIAQDRPDMAMARRILGPVREAGIYHVGTGTWTRGSNSWANLGPDVIFNADTGAGYFAAFPADSEVIDEGILPGTNNSNKTGNPGPQDSYLVDGFQFGYCSTSMSGVDWEFKFYDSYGPCDLPSSTSCTNLAGSLPPISLPGGGFCWLATFDLSLGGYEICMEADGGICAPGYDGPGPDLDHFGWSHSWSSTGNPTTGPFISGHDPVWFPEGEGTVYQPAFTNNCGLGYATGLGSRDFFAIDGSPSLSPGCYWFGGYVSNNGCGAAPNNPGGQFYMRMFTDATSACAGSVCTSVFCDTHAGNLASAGLSTCDCSSGSILLTLTTGGAFEGQFTYPLIGLGTTVVNPTGTSELCLAGSTIGRYNLDAMAISGGQASVDILNSASAPGGMVPTIGGPLCNGNTWRFQWWHRDGMNPSRFSKGIAGTIN